MKPSAGGSRSSGFGAVTCSMYPVGLERLDQCFHFGQSIRLRQLGSRSRGRQHRAGREASLPCPALRPFRLCRRLAADRAPIRVPRRCAIPRPGRQVRCATRAIAALSNNPATSDFVQVFGRRDADTIHAVLRPASKKRQGTKSRDVSVGGAACAMGILPQVRAC